ncbi:MAG: transcriptional regulator NrdR [Nanobdellota archaeon]
MRCPYCSHDTTRVIDSRDTTEDITRRRRECDKCSKRFTTYERIEMVDLFIIKKDGSRELFDREKIRRGILKASEKRDISISKIEEVIDKVETDLRRKDSTEINSKEVGKAVIKHLKRLDNVVYIRFASVYREFADIESFEKELRKLLKRHRR